MRDPRRDVITLEWLREIGGPRIDPAVRIWSGEHRAWWRPSGAGYTTELAAAGVYGLRQAYEATRHCGPEKRIRYHVVRTYRRDVRNPILALPAFARLQALPLDAKGALEAVLADLVAEEAALAEKSWKSKKGPMAAYHKAVSVYAKHIRRALLTEVADG